MSEKMLLGQNIDGVLITPYSALASGRLSRLPGTGSTKRADEGAYAKFKYDATAEQDNVIIFRVAELAGKTWYDYDGNIPCMAADQGDFAHRWSNEVTSR